MKFETYKIKDLVDEISMGPFGSNIKVECFVDHGIPVLNGSNLTDYAVNDDKLRYVTEEKADSLGKANAYRGDIIVTHRGTLGQISFIPDNSKYDRYVISQSQFRIRCNDKILPEYMVYYFHTKEGQNKLLSNASQVGVPALARATTTFQSLEMDVPGIEEQKKIIYFLENIRSKISLNNHINQNLEQETQTIFKRFFIDSTYQVALETTLGSVCTCVLGGTPSRNKAEYWQGMIPWINSGEINRFRITSPSEYITDAGLEHSSTKLLPPKTTVLAITGATLGQVSLLEIESCANQSVVGVIPNETLPYEFIYPFIQANIQELISHQTGGAQQHINKQNIEGLPITVPSSTILAEYCSLVSPLYEVISLNCFENDRLVMLRDTLLPKLMSGELDVSSLDI